MFRRSKPTRVANSSGRTCPASIFRTGLKDQQPELDFRGFTDSTFRHDFESACKVSLLATARRRTFFTRGFRERPRTDDTTAYGWTFMFLDQSLSAFRIRIASGRSELYQEHEVHPYAVVLIRPGTLRNPSGKVRRRACQEAYLAADSKNRGGKSRSR